MPTITMLDFSKYVSDYATGRVIRSESRDLVGLQTQSEVGSNF